MAAATEHSKCASVIAELAAFGGIPGEPVVLVDRRDVTVVRVGTRVVKLHAPEADRLDDRLTVATRHPDVFVAPIPFDTGLTARLDDRYVTRWPYGVPVDSAEPDAAPWTEGARLLGRLHAGDPSRLPSMRGPARLLGAVARMRDCSESTSATTVYDALATLADWTLGTAPPPVEQPIGLTHGDWHLGQLVHIDGDWRLIDVDDAGAGPITWDLARPAAWFAAGMLDDATFGGFLREYAAAGGTAVPEGDPWRVLDEPARALTVQVAAIAVVNAARDGRPLDEVEELLIESCRRIVAVSKLP